MLSWLAGARSRHRVTSRLAPLAQVEGWHKTDTEIAHDEGDFFRVIGVHVTAGNREIGQWCQPLLSPCPRGVVAFITRWADGAPYVLARASAQQGYIESVEIGPAVQAAEHRMGGTNPPPRRRAQRRTASRALQYPAFGGGRQILPGCEPLPGGRCRRKPNRRNRRGLSLDQRILPGRPESTRQLCERRSAHAAGVPPELWESV